MRCVSPFAAFALSGLSAVAHAQPDGAFDLAAALSEGPTLSAEQAAELAVERAPSIERAEALTRAAEAAVLRTRTQLFPRLELSARYAHVDGFPDARIGAALSPEAADAARGLADQIADPAARALWLDSIEQQTNAGVTIEIPRDQLTLSARLSYPVSDILFAVLPALEAGAHAADASRAQERAREARVRLHARESFYQLARARGGLAVAQRAVDQAREQLAQIDAAVRAGLRAPADLASAEARLAASEQAVVNAETAVEVANAALRTLLAEPEGAPYAIAEPLLLVDGEQELPTQSALLAQARAQRAELTALRASIEARHAAAEADGASGLPKLSVYVGADYARPNRYVIPPSRAFEPSWEVGAWLSYAPNDSLAAARRARENGANIAALEAELAELDRALTLEVVDARARLSRASRSIAAARKAESAAQAAHDRRMAELRTGQVVLAELLSAEDDLNRARLLLLDAAIERRLAQVRLAYAVGE